MEKQQESISLNKFISSTGICSRREADKFIEQKKVTINNKIAVLGNRVFPKDQVKLNGKLIKTTQKKRTYIAFNKPPGIICTTDVKERGNIITFINHPKRIFPIGRLDKPSSGLILLTDDGDIVNKILRVGNKHEKEYIVTVDKPISKSFIDRMSKGLPILGTKTKKCIVTKINSKTFRIILTQGLNRQIRRMCEFLQYNVLTLKRVRIMHINLDNIPVGKWRNLSNKELDILKTSLKVSSKT